MDGNSKSLDILGVKPVADAVNTVTEGSVKGAAAFFGAICMPAAEELGLLLKDKVSAWRQSNALKITMQAKRLVEDRENTLALSAPPKIILKALDQGSWEESDELQRMWAGLLASACTTEGKDESNIIFMNVITQLTALQAKLLSYLCEKAEVFCSEAGWIYADEIIMDLAELREFTGVQDEQRLDLELDHLRGLGLILNGFDPTTHTANVTPTSLCLQLHTRAQGYVGSPVEYFGATVKPYEDGSDLDDPWAENEYVR